jgi:hypothetical protein
LNDYKKWLQKNTPATLKDVEMLEKNLGVNSRRRRKW